jgi:GntR family transcriptional regulator
MHLHLSLSHPLSLYEQVEEQIKEKILSGELQPDEGLPSIRGLALELATSVITVKRAYQELESEGWVYTRPGLGTFVSAVDPEKIRQAAQEKIIEHLSAALREAARGGLPEGQVTRLLEKLIKERGKK